MKRLLFALAAVLLAFAACQLPEKETAAATEQNAEADSLQLLLTQKEHELSAIMGTLNEINEGFRKINEAEGRVNMERTNGERSNRAVIIENMTLIQQTLKFNKDLIASLRQQLKTSGANNEKLQENIDKLMADLTRQMEEKDKEIALLRSELEQKNIRIAELDEEVSELTTDVSSLTAANEEKTQTVAQQDKMLHTAWYVFGTKKELREQNILVDGKVMRSDAVNKDYFTRIDIRETKSIKLYSKSAKLLTAHPAGSYAFEKDGKGQYTFRILDAEKFWSVSRYLVISVR